MEVTPVAIGREKLGNSVEGRAIEAFFFGVELDAAAQAPVDTLFIGVFHGDEGIAGELMTRFVADLQVGGLATLASLNRPFIVLPVLNPDGLARKTRVNARGVDLNRNFPAENWAHDGQDTPYYGGPAAGSEPETQIVIDLIEKYRPRKIVTVHSPYKVINFDGSGRPLAEAMAVSSGYAVVESIGYPTPGSFGTYAGIERNIPVITLELPEDESIEQVWADNRESLYAAVRFGV